MTPVRSPGESLDALLGESLDDEFLDVVCGDEELLRAEFDAIVRAAWPELPPVPQPGPSRRVPRIPARETPRPVLPVLAADTIARERSPPGKPLPVQSS